MRAWRYEAFGPVQQVLRLVEADDPVAAPGEAIVGVRWASANPLDFKLVEGRFRWLAKSRPPAGVGSEFSGDVLEVGAGVESLAVGARVVGYIDPWARPPGAMQTRVAVPARDLLEVPAGVALDVAATLPVAGMSALQLCSTAQVGPGKRVLVNGASGGVGGFAVQIARIRGAEVTGTGGSASQPVICELGARAIDYNDPVERWGGPFDAVLDCAARLTAGDQKRLLAGGGRYISTLPAFPAVLVDPLRNLFARTRRYTLRLARNADDLRLLLAWAEEGRLAPQIAQRFAFDQLVAALVQLRDGHPRGKLLLAVG